MRTAKTRRIAAVRRYFAAGSAVLLVLLWYGGAVGLFLPDSVDPRKSPVGYAAAQFLLFLVLLPAAAGTLRRGFAALKMRHPDTAALFSIATTAALLDGAFMLIRIAATVGAGANTVARSMALNLPMALQCGTLLYAAYADRNGAALPQDAITTQFCRILLPLAIAFSGLAGGASLYRGGGFAAASHTLLAALSLCAPFTVFFAAPLLAYAAGKCASLRLTAAALVRIGTAAFCFDDGVRLQDVPALDDLYAVSGNKPALLATAAALASATEATEAAALTSAAASLRLRLPRVTAARHAADSFGGRVHRHAWRFTVADADAPELIRQTDFGGRQRLYAFSGGEFRGVLLFSKREDPGIVAAAACLREAGAMVYAPEDLFCAGASFSGKLCEKVLHVERDGATIKLTDEDGMLQTQIPASASLATVVLLGRQAVASLRVAYAVSAVTVLLCAALTIDMRPEGFPAAAAMRLASMVAVLLLSLLVRRFRPSEIHIEEERPAMFGKVNFTIHVEGMSCSHCAAHVKNALEAIHGVSADVVLDEKMAHVKCPAALDEKQLVDAVTDAGFTVASIARV